MDQAFLLREVYSGRYCFRTRFYWRDSARNVRDICQVRRQVRESVNDVRVDLHGWQGEDCDTNEFAVMRQGAQAWFVPFCDEMGLPGGNPADTTFATTDLVVTRPLNAALRGLALRNRRAFLTTFLHAVCAAPGQRVTRANYATLLDPKLRAYLRPRLNNPGLFYFRVVRLARYDSRISPVWEFDDTHADGLRVQVLRPTWYECISM
ncbi:hypothetical protein [Hymenobacter arizonensis]|uniref:hypothetical protein n=1 Tax=Hymenobacter arizonensis TaxID=1227077 RepID=UPI00116029E7|nr:hypothetical protein [Hymenobacter arizonensis]